MQRNEELHSALAPFTGLDEEAWWERYWSQTIILVHAQDGELADFVGSMREATVEGHLARNSENVARRTQAMIERARQRWEAAASSRDAQAEIASLVVRPGYAADFSDAVECPACDESGLLLGDYVIDSDVQYDEEEGTAMELLSVAADAFECESCGLRLHATEYLHEAGLPDSFDTDRDYEPVYEDYMNE